MEGLFYFLVKKGRGQTTSRFLKISFSDHEISKPEFQTSQIIESFSIIGTKSKEGLQTFGGLRNLALQEISRGEIVMSVGKSAVLPDDSLIKRDGRVKLSLPQEGIRFDLNSLKRGSGFGLFSRQKKRHHQHD